MAATLAALIVYAVIPYTLTVKEFSLKKIAINIEKQPSNTPKQPITKTKQKTTKQQKHHTFLFIGDSMVEGLARRMGDYAAENNYKLYTVIWYSSTTEKWANSNTLEHFIKTYQPTYILLCLGSNELFVNDLQNRENNIKTIIHKLQNHTFLWIGPAQWNGNTGILDLIYRHASPRHYFDSSNLKLQRGPDHYHPTWEAATQWMDKVVNYMGTQQTADPITLKKPQGKHKATKTILLQPDFEGY